jgi:hypothetical protein
MVMKNKRGWIRIVEAFIAVLLVMIVMLSIYSRPAATNRSDEIQKMISAILDEASNDNQLRQEVLDGNSAGVTTFVSERLPNIMNFTVKICEVEDICNLPDYKENVYADERIISATVKTYNPKKLKLFVWECSTANCQPAITLIIPPATTCTDGTAKNSCNVTNKPKYCDSSLNLVDNCAVCGCPSGEDCQNDGSCAIRAPVCDSSKVCVITDCEDVSGKYIKKSPSDWSKDPSEYKSPRVKIWQAPDVPNLWQITIYGRYYINAWPRKFQEYVPLNSFKVDGDGNPCGGEVTITEDDLAWECNGKSATVKFGAC